MRARNFKVEELGQGVVLSMVDSEDDKRALATTTYVFTRASARVLE